MQVVGVLELDASRAPELEGPCGREAAARGMEPEVACLDVWREENARTAIGDCVEEALTVSAFLERALAEVSEKR